MWCAAKERGTRSVPHACCVTYLFSAGLESIAFCDALLVAIGEHAKIIHAPHLLGAAQLDLEAVVGRDRFVLALRVDLLFCGSLALAEQLVGLLLLIAARVRELLAPLFE